MIRREDVVIRDLTAQYARIAARAKADLDKLDARIADDTARGIPQSDTTRFMRFRAQQVVNQFTASINALSKSSADAVKDGQGHLIQYALDNTQDLVNASLGPNPVDPTVELTLTRPPAEDVATFMGFAGDGSPLRDLFDSIGPGTGQTMTDIIAYGIAAGKNPRAIVGQLSKATGIPGRRAETIARTEMIRASREAQRLMYKKNPAIKGYRRQATQDARVCLACLALSGQYHDTDAILPNHPNCRCVMIPETMSWAEITGDPTIPETRTMPADSKALLAGLDPADILGIMGPARYTLWQSGVPLSRMARVVNDPVWGPSLRIVPLDQLDTTPGPEPIVVPPVVPPVVPKKPRKPRAPKVQPVQSEPPKPAVVRNRDPKWLLDEFRKIRQQRKRTIDEIKADIAAMEVERKAAWSSPDNDVLRKWMKESEPKYKALQEELRLFDGLTPEELKAMHDLLRSNDPIKFNRTPYKNVELGSGQKPIRLKDRKVVDKALDYVMSFIDDRPLAFHGGGTNAFRWVENGQIVQLPIQDVRLVLHARSDASGYCQWTGRGEVALHPTMIGWPNEFVPTSLVKPMEMGRTLAHEMVHWLDARNADVRNAFSGFFQKRTAGDTWEKSPYGGQYKRDKWPDEYCGKRYTYFEREYDPNGHGLEVPTRGVELLLANPLRFAESDFEYFSIIVENVLGTGGKP